MTEQDKAQWRAIQHRLRDTHQRIFDVQGDAITGLREALAVLAATHDQMRTFFQRTREQ